jgi:uncharacterized protein (DUF2147 family)
MTKVLSLTAIALCTVLVTGIATASEEALGTWQTESSDKGYLHVTIEPCDAAASRALCGKIKMAYGPEGDSNDTYEHLGKQMIWGMNPKSGTSWAGGKIWDPSGDKTYKSKMSVSGDTLSVSGCVLMFCRAQQWTRVN